MTLKILHIICVCLSITGFTLRGWWMVFNPPRLQQCWTRIAPHVVDTLLLASALAMVFQWQVYPQNHPWLAAKIVALVIYILLGTIALKRGKTLTIRLTAFAAALLAFGYIVGVALSKSPWIFY